MCNWFKNLFILVPRKVSNLLISLPFSKMYCLKPEKHSALCKMVYFTTFSTSFCRHSFGRRNHLESLVPCYKDLILSFEMFHQNLSSFNFLYHCRKRIFAYKSHSLCSNYISPLPSQTPLVTLSVEIIRKN